MLRPSRYILIDRSAWVQGSYKKWRPSQHQYKKYHRYGVKTAAIPPKNTIKKFKKRVKIKNKKRPPASENL
jgi:hypothetical protein